MKVYFIGAGPGAPDLLTLRGKRILEQAEVVMYAGSLVNREIVAWAGKEAEIFDTSGMDLDAICGVFEARANQDGHIARLHTGDPSLYSAMGEQVRCCERLGIPWEVVPGVSSFSAAAAALGKELTLPGVSQTVILARTAGRTPVPEKESLPALAKLGGTLVLFLSSALVRRAMKELEPQYGPDAPVAVVYRASWADQRIVEGTVSSIASLMEREGIDRQALVLVGNVLKTADFEASRLYAPGFSHGYRQAHNNWAEQPDAQDNAGGEVTE